MGIYQSEVHAPPRRWSMEGHIFGDVLYFVDVFFSI